MRRLSLHVNGHAVHGFAAGPARAPLALLLHGFPDDPRSMFPVAERLLAAGYRVCAPYLRGYGPNGPAPDGRYDPEALGQDVLGWIAAQGAKRALVVGHDWGAVAGYAAVALNPSAVAALVSLAVPPPRALLANLKRDPAQFRRSAYMTLGRVPGGGALLRAGNYAMIDSLWQRWSPGWTPPAPHLRQVKHTFDYPGTPHAALAYYRALFPLRPWKALRTVKVLTRALSAPTLVLAGSRDGCLGPRVFADSEAAINGPSALHVMDAGHWLQLEHPDAMVEKVREFAQKHARFPRMLPTL